MHYDATLRVRELTQNIYDIGDEVADYIDHVSQAMHDWDRELVADCLEELQEIVAEGCAEVRPDLSELNGLRQAFVSGVRAGRMSNEWTGNSWRDVDHPGRTLSFLARPTARRTADRRNRTNNDSAAGTRTLRGVSGLAYSASDMDNPAKHAEAPGASEGYNGAGATADGSATPAGASARRTTDFSMASTASWRIWLRESTEQLLDELDQLQDWVVEQTQRALDSQSVLLPQCYMRAEQHCLDVHERWIGMLDRQPALAASMRGEAPPKFLSERARVDAVVSRVQRRRRGTAV